MSGALDYDPFSDDALPALPPFMGLPEGRGDEAKTSSLPVEWCEDIQPALTSLWLIKRTLVQQGIGLIYGHPGSGKSFLALDMGMHVALGWDWHGHKVRKGLVVYVAAEGQNGLRNRIVAFREHHGLSGAIPFALVPTPIDLHDPGADRAKLAAVVRMAAKRYGEAPALIFVDTISKTLGAGKENTDDLAVYVSNCGWLAAEFNCCVVPIHHRPKDSESTEPRGHGSLKGGVDTVILVEAGETKKARITKQKDDEERDLLLFNLRSIRLGEDEDHEPVSSCVVEATDIDLSPRDPFAVAVARLRGNNRLVYDQLGEILASEGIPIPPGIPTAQIDAARVGKVALLDAWRDNSISAGGTGAGHNRDTAKRTFNRALQSLKTAGIVRVWNEYAWITHHLPGQDRDNRRHKTGTTGQAGQGSLDPVPLSRPPMSAASAEGQ